MHGHGPVSVVLDPPIGTLGAFFEGEETTLARSDEKLLNKLADRVDRELLSTLETRSEKEFNDALERALPRYARALSALSDTVRNVVPQEEIARLQRDVIEGLTADLEKQGPDRFGARLTEQASFALWTLGKIRELARRIGEAGPVRPDQKKTDREYFESYLDSSLYAQFCLDLLFASIRFQKTVAEGIREHVCEGLRAAVNAYAVMKEAYFLRQPTESDQPTTALPWDAEDERLLRSSMRDVNLDFGT